VQQLFLEFKKEFNSLHSSGANQKMQKIRSKFSGVLEINYVDGEKVLNSKNTSYSYGNLQKVWEKTLQKISFLNVERILILGMGGGSSIHLLRHEFKYKGKIVAIEIDPVIIAIAKNEFDVVEDSNLRIECIDAAAYVKKRTWLYDLILIDIFIDDKIPVKFLAREFWKDLSKKCAPSGQILFNAFTDVSKLKSITEELLMANYRVNQFQKVNGANMMIHAVKAAILSK